MIYRRLTYRRLTSNDKALYKSLSAFIIPFSFILFSPCSTLNTHSFGQFTRLAQPGFNVVCCPCEQQVGKLSFRVQQLNVRVETKTLDNVFLVAVVSVQYQVLRDKCYEAFYALTNPVEQITAHVYDVMRSELPCLVRM